MQAHDSIQNSQVEAHVKCGAQEVGPQVRERDGKRFHLGKWPHAVTYLRRKEYLLSDALLDVGNAVVLVGHVVECAVCEVKIHEVFRQTLSPLQVKVPKKSPDDMRGWNTCSPFLTRCGGIEQRKDRPEDRSLGGHHQKLIPVVLEHN